jgi:manganese oxidase
VDREFVESLVTIDENQSWFIDDNIKRFAPDPKKYDKFDTATAADHRGNLDLLLATGSGFSNLRWTINGYQFASGPMPQMKKDGFNFHTPHWHGNTVLVGGQRTDVLNLAPAQMITADMVPDNAGIWLFHCHVSEHMQAGMASRYEVLP